jgi:hypothetical protein
MMLGSQIKYWVFGTVGVGGVYLVLFTWSNSQTFAVGATAIAACIGATILGGVWDSTKSAEKAATYKKLARDEEARQAWQNVMAQGAKQLEAPNGE